jgi:hypothetical protein
MPRRATTRRPATAHARGWKVQRSVSENVSEVDHRRDAELHEWREHSCRPGSAPLRPYAPFPCTAAAAPSDPPIRGPKKPPPLWIRSNDRFSTVDYEAACGGAASSKGSDEEVMVAAAAGDMPQRPNRVFSASTVRPPAASPRRPATAADSVRQQRHAAGAAAQVAAVEAAMAADPRLKALFDKLAADPSLEGTTLADATRVLAEQAGHVGKALIELKKARAAQPPSSSPRSHGGMRPPTPEPGSLDEAPPAMPVAPARPRRELAFRREPALSSSLRRAPAEPLLWAVQRPAPISRSLRVCGADPYLLAYPGVGWHVPGQPLRPHSARAARQPIAPGSAAQPWTRRPQTARVHSFTVHPQPAKPGVTNTPLAAAAPPKGVFVSQHINGGDGDGDEEGDGIGRGDVLGTRTKSQRSVPHVTGAPHPALPVSEQLAAAMGDVQLSSSRRSTPKAGVVPLSADNFYFAGKRDGSLRPVSSFRPRPVLRIPAHLPRMRLMRDLLVQQYMEWQQQQQQQLEQTEPLPPQPSELDLLATSAIFEANATAIARHAAITTAAGWEAGDGGWEAQPERRWLEESTASAVLEGVPASVATSAIPCTSAARSPRGAALVPPEAVGAAAHADRIRQARACAALGALA